MEMPLYKLPSPRIVVRRMYDSAMAFLRRAGTLILASMVLVWALLYFPSHDAAGKSYDVLIAEAERSIEQDREELAKAAENDESSDRQEELRQRIAATEVSIKEQQHEWKANSLLGRMGRGMEPVFAPLGWDWRIGTAALASFPAREVVVGTLGIIYKVGKVESEQILEGEDPGLGDALKKKEAGYSVPVALSLMVFFALCCQCASTLAVIRRVTTAGAGRSSRSRT
jgi:ferrous iron transport protein B